MNKDSVKYWLDLSDYDLETAIVMLNSKRFLYVGYMCHQVIEKILKAYYCTIFDDSPPYTHSLSYLAKKSELLSDIPENYLDFLDELEPLNIEARYPSHKEKLFKALNNDKCEYLLNNTKSLQSWIKSKL